MKSRKLHCFDSEKRIHLQWRDLLLGGNSCERCGGLLTRDEDCGISRVGRLPSLRCIQCGEWMDEIVIRNRVMTGLRGAANRNRLVRKDYQYFGHGISGNPGFMNGDKVNRQFR
jgi:hypothetical protein